MLVLIRVFHTIRWKVYNVPLIQLREFLMVRYYSSRLTLNWPLSIWTEFHNCITFGCTSLSVFLGGRRNPCLNMSYGPSSLPHGHLSFPAILCLSWSEGFRFVPLSLRIAIVEMSLLRSEAGLNCFIRSSAGLRLEAAEREEKGAKKGQLPIWNKGLQRRLQPRTREKLLTWMGSYPITLTSGDREG